jgi:hypothetical protein
MSSRQRERKNTVPDKRAQGHGRTQVPVQALTGGPVMIDVAAIEVAPIYDTGEPVTVA